MESRSRFQLEDVNRTVTGTDLGESVPNGLRRDPRRFTSSLLEGLSLGQAGCKRGRMRAARSVRSRRVVTLDRDLHMVLAVEEMVHLLVAVSARDDDCRSAELVDALGQRAARAAAAGERLGLLEVRRHDRG